MSISALQCHVASLKKDINIAGHTTVNPNGVLLCGRAWISMSELVHAKIAQNGWTGDRQMCEKQGDKNSLETHTYAHKQTKFIPLSLDSREEGRRVKREREKRCLRLIGERRRRWRWRFCARVVLPRGHRFGNGRETMPNAAAVRLPPPIRLSSVTRRDRGWRRRGTLAVIFQPFS